MKRLIFIAVIVFLIYKAYAATTSGMERVASDIIRSASDKASESITKGTERTISNLGNDFRKGVRHE